jgi:hypothetical protein
LRPDNKTSHQQGMSIEEVSKRILVPAELILKRFEPEN